MDPFTAIGAFLTWAFTTASVEAFVVRTAIFVAGSMLLNRMLAPGMRDDSGGGYAFGSQTTQAEGEAIAVAIGANRVHANIVAHYTRVAAHVSKADAYQNFGPGSTPRLRLGDAYTYGTPHDRCLLACFGEGPWEAPDDTTIRINGRPLSDFAGLTAEWRLGTVDQAVLTDWSTFRQDYHNGAKVLHGAPVTMALGRTGWDDIEVHLQFSGGAVEYSSKTGNALNVSVGVKVEVGDAVAGTWQTLAEEMLVMRSRTPLRFAYVASSTYAGGAPFAVTGGMRPQVRVTRTTAPGTSPSHVSELELAAVQVIRNIGFTHPGMVLLALTAVPTELTVGGITEISVVSTGKIVSDGAGGFGVSRYGSDAIREILTQPVIEGDGGATPWSASYYRGVSASRLVGTGWSAQKTVADQLVPDGRGGNVEMLRFDTVFARSGSAHAAIGQVCVSSRCGLSYVGNSFGLWVETARTPVGLLCDGTCRRGSIQWTPIEQDALAAEIAARYQDADTEYRERTIFVRDTAMGTLGEAHLDLPGVTRMHEAARLARRELARNRLVDLTGSGGMDIDAAVYEPGDVLYGQIDGRSLGGRIVVVDGLTLTADRDLYEVATGTDAVVVQVRHATTGVQSVELQTATLTGARTITVPAAWTIAPSVGDPFLFGTEDLQDDQFEVTELSLDEHLHATLALSRYVAALDDLDDLAPGVSIPAAAMTRVYPAGNVATPTVPDATVEAVAVPASWLFEIQHWSFLPHADPGKIYWTSLEDEDGNRIGYVQYNNELYQPADDTTGTSDRYVYWDEGTPAAFLTTDDPLVVVGHRLVAINDGGTPIYKGGLVWGGEAGTINLDDVIDGTSYKKMTAAERTKLTGVEAGADVTATHTAAAISGQGALATQNSVDLSSGEVTNKTAANIAETADRKWAGESGADVTRDHVDEIVCREHELVTWQNDLVMYG